LAIGWGELNVKAEDDGVSVRVVVSRSLLSAVAGGLGVAIVYDLRIRRQKANFGDMGPARRSGQRVNVRL